MANSTRSSLVGRGEQRRTCKGGCKQDWLDADPAQYPQNRGDKQGLNFTERDPRQFAEPYVDV